MNKTVLVTGCSTGLGLCVAVRAAAAGREVVATMRDLSKRGALDAAARNAGVALEVRALDVQDTASIDAVVSEMVATYGGIGVLINNAGAGFVRTTEQASEEEIARVMDVNFLGVVRCTKAVLPHMRAARSGRVINISSVGGLVGQPFNEIYCAAKFAVEGFTESLATYVGRAFGLSFTAIEPGGISSEFANNVLAAFMQTGGMRDDEYRPLLERYITDARARATRAADGRGQSVFQTPDQVAEVVVACMQAADPPVRLRTSAWAEDLCHFKTSADPDGTRLRTKVIDTFLGGVDAVRR